MLAAESSLGQMGSLEALAYALDIRDPALSPADWLVLIFAAEKGTRDLAVIAGITMLHPEAVEACWKRLNDRGHIATIAGRWS